jgi:hypothetical protein
LNVAIILAGIVTAVAVVIMRQSRRDQRVLRSPSAADRQFIADQFDPFTRLPLSTAEDEDEWDAAMHTTFQRIGERVPEFAREVLPRFFPYFHDADIFRREPSYRAARERYIIKFIHELRTHATKA